MVLDLSDRAAACFHSGGCRRPRSGVHGVASENGNQVYLGPGHSHGPFRRAKLVAYCRSGSRNTDRGVSII